MVYIPRRYFVKFNVLSSLFSSNNVFLELAVPTILKGMVNDYNQTEGLQGMSDWKLQFSLDKVYSSIKHFIHPFKLSQYNSPEKRQLICQYLIQEKLKYL